MYGGFLEDGNTANICSGKLLVGMDFVCKSFVHIGGTKQQDILLAQSIRSLGPRIKKFSHLETLI